VAAKYGLWRRVRASWVFGSAAPCLACRWVAVILPDRGTVILAKDGRSLACLHTRLDVSTFRFCELYIHISLALVMVLHAGTSMTTRQTLLTSGHAKVCLCPRKYQRASNVKYDLCQ
jgi:hypothetical protein